MVILSFDGRITTQVWWFCFFLDFLPTRLGGPVGRSLGNDLGKRDRLPGRVAPPGKKVLREAPRTLKEALRNPWNRFSFTIGWLGCLAPAGFDPGGN